MKRPVTLSHGLALSRFADPDSGVNAKAQTPISLLHKGAPAKELSSSYTACINVMDRKRKCKNMTT